MKRIHIFCFANYCRSPVAEKILKNLLGDNFIVSSSGLKPITRAGMDIRSQKYLKKLGLSNYNHLPSKLSSKDIENNDLILAMDSILLGKLFEKGFKPNKKIKIFHYHDKFKEVDDPYRFEDKEYEISMEKISRHCDHWAKYILDNML